MTSELKNGVKCWFYGEPFVGKTTFSVKFPKPYVLSLDDNAKYSTEHYTSVVDLDELNSFINNTLKKIEKEYDTLIVDTVEYIEEMVRFYFLDKQEIEFESDANDHGRTWVIVREGVKKILNYLLRFKGNVIFISHEESYTKVLNATLGTEAEGYRPAINRKIHRSITGKMHLVGRMTKNERNLKGQRLVNYEISFGSNPHEMSGQRVALKESKIKADWPTFVENFEQDPKDFIKGL